MSEEVNKCNSNTNVSSSRCDKLVWICREIRVTKFLFQLGLIFKFRINNLIYGSGFSSSPSLVGIKLKIMRKVSYKCGDKSFMCQIVSNSNLEGVFDSTSIHFYNFQTTLPILI